MEHHSITLAHRKYVEAFTRKHLPYSDFNFTSLFCWDVRQELRIAEHNGNLVVRFTDYMTGEQFYSFIGEDHVDKTAAHLLDYSEKSGCGSKLMLVPEVTAAKLDRSLFRVEESRDHFDYIYDTGELAIGAGGRFSKYRAKFQNFERRYVEPYPSLVRVEAKMLHERKDSILRVNEAWKRSKAVVESDNEEAAIAKIFDADTENMLVVMISYREEPIGYILNELPEGPYAVTHFGKTDLSYEGINQYLMRKNCEILHFYNKRYLNYEQDLGIAGLRQSKESLRPCHFLKKYTVTRV